MKHLTILIATLVLAACMHQPDDPRKVAEQYWRSMQQGDTAAARTLVSSTSQQNFDRYLALPADQRLPIGAFELGTVQSAIVTVIYADPNAKDNQDTFDTVMVLEDGAWKVDATQTVVPRPPPSDRELNELADELSESMQENMDSMEDAMTEGLQMLNEALREGSRDLGESMLKGMEEMNRALRESIDQMQQRREEQQQKSEPEGQDGGLI
jgi:hypothetical protein